VQALNGKRNKDPDLKAKLETEKREKKELGSIVASSDGHG
jgi:hypothetical protein